MSDTLSSLQRRKESAAKLGAVVRTMKALAASHITQYEAAVNALRDYYRTVALSLFAYFSQKPMHAAAGSANPPISKGSTLAILFGTDQGLVGRFNDSLAGYALSELKKSPGPQKIWAVGSQMTAVLKNSDIIPTRTFNVPVSIDRIADVSDDLLDEIEFLREQGRLESVLIFHHTPLPQAEHEPIFFKLLPLDEQWRQYLAVDEWPTKRPPQVLGGEQQLLPALVREYLFVSLYRACAASLASENASRLNAMTRAQKNIEEMQEELNHMYNIVRQSSIDEELFDVISGFEAMRETVD